MNDTIWSPEAGDYDTATLYRVGRHSGGAPYLQTSLAQVWRDRKILVGPQWEVVLYRPHRERVPQTFSTAEEAKAYAVAIWRLEHGT